IHPPEVIFTTGEQSEAGERKDDSAPPDESREGFGHVWSVGTEGEQRRERQKPQRVCEGRVISSYNPRILAGAAHILFSHGRCLRCLFHDDDFVVISAAAKIADVARNDRRYEGPDGPRISREGADSAVL